eukprot:jgi/Orpsp1_1/1186600/evm.model.d7180000051826.1
MSPMDGRIFLLIILPILLAPSVAAFSKSILLISLLTISLTAFLILSSFLARASTIALFILLFVDEPFCLANCSSRAFLMTRETLFKASFVISVRVSLTKSLTSLLLNNLLKSNHGIGAAP